jgi:septal ring factor EnvC (AmiA/AmiB activator)
MGGAMLAAAGGARRRALFALAGLWLVGLAPAAPAAADPTREEELAEVRRRARRLEAQVAELGRSRAGLEGELIEVDLAVRLQEERAREAGLALEGARSAVEETAHRVRDLQRELGAAREDLGARLGSLYRIGRQGLVRLALAAEDEETFLRDFRLVRYLVRSDAARVDRYLDLRGRLLDRQDELEDRRREAGEWAEREVGRLAEVRRLRQRKAELLAEVLGRERRTRQEVADLERREARLAGFLAALAGERSLAGEPMQQYAGVLDRPVVGSVLRGFGPRLDPRYGTRVPHNGQEYLTLGRAEVRPVYPGTVLFAEPLEGYGLTVVVHHPGRVFSLYSGLEESRVDRGDVVSLSSVLGSSSGRLYFEIRVENKPVDPEAWLR